MVTTLMMPFRSRPVEGVAWSHHSDCPRLHHPDFHYFSRHLPDHCHLLRESLPGNAWRLRSSEDWISSSEYSYHRRPHHFHFPKHSRCTILCICLCICTCIYMYTFTLCHFLRNVEAVVAARMRHRKPWQGPDCCRSSSWRSTF